MLNDYIAAGFDPAAFWRLTPRLYVAHMDGAAARLNREHKERAWLAYHVAYLPMQKKAVKFEDLAGETKAKSRSKTWAEQLAAWEVFATTR